MTELALRLPVEVVEAIVDVATERALERLRVEQLSRDVSSPWLYGAQAAADYLGMPLGKVQKLTAAKDKTRALPHRRRDGEQRIVYRTDELDEWIERVYEYEGPPRLRLAG